MLFVLMIQYPLHPFVLNLHCCYHFFGPWLQCQLNFSFLVQCIPYYISFSEFLISSRSQFRCWLLYNCLLCVPQFIRYEPLGKSHNCSQLLFPSVESGCNIIDFDGFSKETVLSSLCQIPYLHLQRNEIQPYFLLCQSAQAVPSTELSIHLLSSPIEDLVLQFKNSPSLGHAPPLCRVTMFKVTAHSYCLFLPDQVSLGELDAPPPLLTVKTQAHLDKVIA